MTDGPRDRLAGAAALLLGVGIAVNALLGPLVFGVIHIRESAKMENQLLGGELTSLLLAAPMALVASVLWWRGSRLAPAIAIAPAGFALYTYVQFVLVPDYTRYEGDNERYFLLYLALVVLGWGLAARAWHQLSRMSLPTLPTRFARTTGVAFIVLNGAIAIAWIASVLAVGSGTHTREYAEHPTGFWLIRLMDLGFVIPLALATGGGLIARAPWSTRATYAYAGAQGLLSCAVAGMAIRMTVRHDPDAPTALLGVTVVAALTFAAINAKLYRLLK